MFFAHVRICHCKFNIIEFWTVGLTKQTFKDVFLAIFWHFITTKSNMQIISDDFAHYLITNLYGMMQSVYLFFTHFAKDSVVNWWRNEINIKIGAAEIWHKPKSLLLHESHSIHPCSIHPSLPKTHLQPLSRSVSFCLLSLVSFSDSLSTRLSPFLSPFI